MPELVPVIGLEVHAQLRTRTKLFCRCANDSGGPPNNRVCPVCLGLPGALPVPSREAVRLAVRFAAAVGATAHPTSVWARKNYFYPDLPKGYQISQFDRPVASGGAIRIEPAGGGPPVALGLVRAHLEEDAGKSVHEGLPAGQTGVDLNRCGVPLLEIVGAPDIHDPDSAYLYLERLKSILRATGVSTADMEKGELRCDANVSVHEPGTPFGTRVEIKNLNSFRHVRRALEYEIARQKEVLAQGGEVAQETRLWDEAAGVTRPMRSKEEAHDYRYFPDPDLPPLVFDEALVADALAGMPELPAARRDRYVAAGVPAADAHRLTIDHELADYYDAVAAAAGSPRAAANWVLGELLGRLNAEGLEIAGCPVGPERLAVLVRLQESRTITGKVAKELFEEIWRTGADPEALVAERGLAQVSDASAVEPACAAVIEGFPSQVAQYRAGKTAVLGFLVGQVMKASRGTANPEMVQQILRRLLDAPAGTPPGAPSEAPPA